jgi:hypothetical protein
MPNTFELIASDVLSSTTSSVTFSSIPATFTDLVLKLAARSDTNSVDDLFYIRLNGVTSSLYSFTNISGNGSSVSSSRGSGSPLAFNYLLNGATSTANTFTNFELYIPSYTVSQSKSIGSFGVRENNTSSALILNTASVFRSNSAISEITAFPGFGSFVSGSSFYLYGIKNS